MISLLLLTLAIPAITAVLLMLLGSSAMGRSARWIALTGACAALASSLVLAREFRAIDLRLPVTQPDGAAPMSHRSPVLPRVSARYDWFTVRPESDQLSQPVRLQLHFGLDGISTAMIALTTLLTVSCVLISWESIREREAEFYAALLILEAGLIGVFAAFDVLLFYVFFEFTLIPLFFMIAIWGGPQRRFAAVKFFLYTLAGSLITLIGVVGLVVHLASSGLATPCSIPDMAEWLRTNPLDSSMQMLFFLSLSAGFLIKVPVFPFHTWLPLAHVEAPTAGSVLLAGVLLKLGTYGFLRLCLPMFPSACLTVGVPLIGILSVVGIIYGSLCALAQRDIKKLVAYSSVAHLGFCTLGLFALTPEGVTGSVLQMINHGLSTGGLFLLVGMVYDRYHTRQLDDLGGLANRLPLIACAAVFISMASIGLPGLNGFVGEILSLIGMFVRNKLYAILGAAGVVLGAWYLLTMLQHAFFGPLKEPHHGDSHVGDLNIREFLAIAPIAAACLWIGLYPAPLLDIIHPDVAAVTAIYPEPKFAPRPSVETSPASAMEFASTFESASSSLNPESRPGAPGLNPSSLNAD